MATGNVNLVELASGVRLSDGYKARPSLQETILNTKIQTKGNKQTNNKHPLHGRYDMQTHKKKAGAVF